MFTSTLIIEALHLQFIKKVYYKFSHNHIFKNFFQQFDLGLN